MRVSVLDRSRTRAGESDAQAVASTIDRAVQADARGLHRFWTAEHHAVPGIASSAPGMLAAAIGARTQRIRVGTGGIMVPNHSPMVVAEQAMLLEALYPGRVDIGLGGSLGFTAPVRSALRRTELRDGEYAGEVREVIAYLDGTASLTVRPSIAPPPVFVLAIKAGLALAAELGLPAVVGGPLLGDQRAIDAYHRDFVARAPGDRPYLIASTDVMVADTAEAARDVLLSEAWAFADARDVGEFRALQPVAEVQRRLHDATERKRAAVTSFVDSAVTGTPAQATVALKALAERTGASELMLHVSAFDRADVARTDEFLAALQR
jgi:luciferase family oxidoreductase group 1